MSERREPSAQAFAAIAACAAAHFWEGLCPECADTFAAQQAEQAAAQARQKERERIADSLTYATRWIEIKALVAAFRARPTEPTGEKG